MTIDPYFPPLLTSEFPGIGGQIKVEPDDFVVEEIPAYEPSGEGQFLYLWVEKRNTSADYLLRQISKRLDLPQNEIGMAGRKDRHAVTRQMISVPEHVEAKLEMLDDDEIRVLNVHRHSNKLKTGHLQGNRFDILIRQVESADSLAAIVTRLSEMGVPNYYGQQRFGHDFETGRIGLGMLQGKSLAELAPQDKKKWKHPNQRRFVLSAGQSVLFNLYLGQRLQENLSHKVLSGDVMGKWPRGGIFVAEDIDTEQSRFDARETVMMGPIYGRKTFAAKDHAAEREQAILEQVEVASGVFQQYGKLMMGTRRHNLIYLEDFSAEQEPEGVRCRFTLPAGSYATVVLREIMKTDLRNTPE